MEVYISTDIEADGPIPGPNSMLSLGSAAYDVNGKLLGTFSVCFDLLEGATPAPETMAWWKTQPDAWEAARKDPVPPEEGMKKFVEWVDSIKGSPVFVGYPASYDFLFVYWYLIKFTGKSPFSFSALDMKTYAMCVLGTDFKATSKRTMPQAWFKGLPPHTHKAVDDAVEQGALFCRMLVHPRSAHAMGKVLPRSGK